MDVYPAAVRRRPCQPACSPRYPFSVAFALRLDETTDISMAVPVCNALTFVFTAATAMWLGERVDHPGRKLLGMASVLLGIAICVASKLD